MTPRRPNLRQIATELGLSVTTVSRALKDGPEVRPETTEKVKAAAQKLGYAPNPHGLALRTGRTNSLTVVLPLETRAYLADIGKVPLIEGMTLAARRAGYMLSICSVGPDEDQLELLRRLGGSATTDGVIITRITSGDPRIGFLQEQNLPFASFGRSDGGIDHAWVDIDNEAMCHDAAERLFAQGHRRIALQLPSRDDLLSRARLAGFARAHEAAGLQVAPERVGHDLFTMAESAAFFGQVLDGPMPPSALICANELGLLGAVRALRDRGLRPGRDVALVTRDSSHMSSYLALPALMHFVDMAEIGQSLIAALIGRIETPAAPPTQVLVKGVFVQLTGAD